MFKEIKEKFKISFGGKSYPGTLKGTINLRDQSADLLLDEDNENTESPVREKKQSYQPTICVDFDGVIHKYSKGWNDGTIYDEPIEGAISSMAKLQRKGFRVVIFTARREYLEIGLWLKKHDVKKELNFNEMIITSTKLPAVAYIDDRAIRFVNWTEALNYF